MTITKEDVWNVFWWGVQYGQLLMEEERENEETFDAFLCAVGSRKYALPTTPVRRRQIHGEKWFDAMRQGHKNFLEYYISLNQAPKNIGSNDQGQFDFEEGQPVRRTGDMR
jgi:hypothetical protein